MVGKFDVILTGVEETKSKDGKDTYLYANFLQDNEVRRVRVEERKTFDELSRLGKLKEIVADIEITVKMWQGSTYVNYRLVNCKVPQQKS